MRFDKLAIKFPMRGSIFFTGLAFLAATCGAGAVSIDLAGSGALIVAPSAARAEALRLAAALKESGCAAPDLAADTVSPARGRPLIILGNAPGNRLLRRLYFEAYDFADYAFPGPGNASVRTIPDPLETGADVVVVEASEVGGLALAVTVFTQELKKTGCKLGYLNQVVAGPKGRISDPYAKHLDPAFDWAAADAGAGSWDYMEAVARCGLGYLYTGNEAYLPIFRDHLRDFYKRRVLETTTEKQIHGFTHWLVNVWDLIGPHPFFDADRKEIDDMLLAILRSKEGPQRIAAEAKRDQIRGNHSTRTALDAYFGGRWAWRRLQLDEGKEWMEIAARFYKPQLGSAKPMEDSWGHQWNASLLNTATYALATGNQDYFASEPLRQAAGRALIAHSHRESGPHQYLALVAAASGDPRYLSLTRAVDPALSARSFLPAHGGSDEFLRAFAFFREAPFDPRATGVAVAPLDRLWYDTVDKIKSLSPEGAFARTAPFEETFDKICFREGYGADDLYLLFDGISGGAHAYQDANCVKRYVEGGVDWLGTGGGGHSTMTVRQENGVFLALDGAGAGRIHRFARKLYANAKDDFLLAGAALTGVGGADWERHIIRRKGRWTVVIDRAIARQPGELLVERHWWVKGEARAESGGLISQGGPSAKPVFLHLHAAGVQEASLGAAATEDAAGHPLRGPRERLERVRTRVEAAGGAVEIAAILYVDKQVSPGRFKVARTDQGWLVEGDGDRVLLGSLVPALAHSRADVEPAAPPKLEFSPPMPDWRIARLPARITAIAPVGPMWAAGDAYGNVQWGALVVRRPQPISALHFYPGGRASGRGLCVGEEDGTLSLINAGGTVRWSVKMPWQPPQWAYWTEGRSRAREIDTADLDGDGTPEILVANSDRHLWAFDAQGKQLFRTPVEWGVLTAMTTATLADQVRILGGTSHPSIFGRLLSFDAKGVMTQPYTRPDLADWSFPAEMRDVRVANIDGGEKQQILTAVDTGMRQLLVYREDGKIAWEADVAGGPTAVALLNGRIICATGAGYLLAFDGTGARQWSVFLGERVRLLAVQGDAVDAVTDHDVMRFNREGRPLSKVRLPSAVATVPRPGAHRAGDRLLLGLEDGTIISR
jgi:hypothetical protein